MIEIHLTGCQSFTSGTLIMVFFPFQGYRLLPKGICATACGTNSKPSWRPDKRLLCGSSCTAFYVWWWSSKKFNLGYFLILPTHLTVGWWWLFTLTHETVPLLWTVWSETPGYLSRQKISGFRKKRWHTLVCSESIVHRPFYLSNPKFRSCCLVLISW